MRGRTRRVGVAVMLAAVTALASSCSSTPKTYGPCHHVLVHPAPGGGGYVAAYDWDNKIHAYGEPVPFTACLSVLGSTAAAEGPPGVTLQPTEQPIGKVEFGVVTFTVTVTEGSAGPIGLRLQDGADAFATPPGPVITPADGGWRFTSPDLS